MLSTLEIKNKLEMYKKEIIMISLSFLVQVFFLFIFSKISNFPIVGGDSQDFINLSKDFAPLEAFRTPFYSYFLKVFNFLSSSHHLLFVVLVQITLSSFGAIIFFKISKIFFENIKLQYLALFFYIFSLNITFHSQIILSDSLFGFGMILFVYWFLSTLNPIKPIQIIVLDDKYTFVFLGFFVGFLSYVRPIALYLPLAIFLLSLIIFLLNKNNLYYKNLLKNTFIILIVSSLLVVPWFIRNKINSGIFAFSSISSYNIFYYNLDEFSKSTFASNSTREMYDRDREKIENNNKDKRLLENQNTLKEASNNILENQKINYLLFHLYSTNKFFLSSTLRYIILFYPESVYGYFGLGNIDKDLSTLVSERDYRNIFIILKKQALLNIDRIFNVLIFILFIFSIIFGIRDLAKKEFKIEIWFLIFIIFYFAILTGPVSIPRYRLPVEPFLAIMSIWGGVNLINLIKNIKIIKKYERK